MDKYSEHPRDILAFAARARAGGADCALTVITEVEGGSSRGVGALMAIAEDGAAAGSVSSGCIDANVVAIARDALRDQRARTARFGAGSPYVDVKLPCGGGVDLAIGPAPYLEALNAAVAALDDRTPVFFSFSSGAFDLSADDRGPAKEAFRTRLSPKLRLIVAGRGAELIAAARVSRAAGFLVEAFSPDEADCAACRSVGASASKLISPERAIRIATDPWTAVTTLFHEHEWEPAVLKAAIAGDPFYIGALGSRRTHRDRLERLSGLGVCPADLARIRGPIGLAPSTRNATALALSTLAEIIDADRRRNSEDAAAP